MPLKRGSSDAICANIAELRRAGYPADQAAAIAYHEAGRGGRGYVADVLREVERLVKQGWPRESAIKSAEFAVVTRGGEGGRARTMRLGMGIPDAQERAAFDIPLARWAGAMLGGRGDEAAVRVPESPQATNYTCGPAALRGAMGAFGIGADEDELAAAAETSASGGTSILGLAAAAEARGLETETVQGMTLDDLIACLDEGRVVVACIQAGSDEEDYDASHWVVPCAVRDENGVLVVEMMDPAVEGARSVAPADEFVERWHCIDMGERIEGLGLVLRGDAPANMTAVEQPITPL